jgi:hypothetical protein
MKGGDLELLKCRWKMLLCGSGETSAVVRRVNENNQQLGSELSFCDADDSTKEPFSQLRECDL